MNSFYLTLHSHGDSHVKTKNDVHDFNIHLGKTLRLPGQWEVGLAQIFYPMAIQPVRKPYNLMQIAFNGKVNDISLGSNTFTSKGLCAVLTLAFRYYDIEMSQVGGWLQFKNGNDIEYKVTMHPTLQNILGVPQNFTLSGNKNLNFYGDLDVNRGVPRELYVHTDLVDYQMVNTGFERLLRIVPNDTSHYKFGCSSNQTFERIQYMRVAKDVVDSVNVYIKDSDGVAIPFAYGTLTVVLHFRQIDG